MWYTYNLFNAFLYPVELFAITRPKPAYGRQGLDWDRWARIQFSQVHFGAKLDSTDRNHLEKPWKPTKNHEKPLKPPWKTMETDQKPWKNMKPPWKPWKPNKNHEKPWNHLEKQWKPIKNYEKPWNHLEKQWKPTKNHEKPWNHLDSGSQLTSFDPKMLRY